MVARLASIAEWHQKVAGSSPAVVKFFIFARGVVPTRKLIARKGNLQACPQEVIYIPYHSSIEPWNCSPHGTQRFARRVTTAGLCLEAMRSPPASHFIGLSEESIDFFLEEFAVSKPLTALCAVREKL